MVKTFINTLITHTSKSLPAVKQDIFCSIAFNYHDSSVSYAIGQKVVLVLEAERVFREKKKVCNKEELEFLVTHGLHLLNKKIGDVSYWSMTTFNNPYLVPRDVVDFSSKTIRSPYWKKLFLLGQEREVLITNHHLSHAGIYLSTKFENAVIISCDGGGDIDPATNNNECVAVFKGLGNTIEKQTFELEGYITGKTYGVCSTFVYGSDIHTKNPTEGKLMALAGYGKVRSEYYTFLQENYHKIERSDYSTVLKILEDSELDFLQGQAAKQTQAAKDFAATVHKFFIDKRLEDVEKILAKMGPDLEAIILTGGASLNIDFNSRILERYKNYSHFVAPCCDDTGQSLGSLCLLVTEVTGKRPDVTLPYLGEGTKDFTYKFEALDRAVEVLLSGGILVVHNGKAEVGPRALGNRSFLARPDNLDVKLKLSEEVKQRESYRPIAPVVIEEKVSEYFNGPPRSPFMLYRYEVIEKFRSRLLGATHIDHSARVQSVDREDNPFLYDLLTRFGDKTGIYVLLNTSLNLRGDPLSNTIQQSTDIYNKTNGSKCLIYNGKILSSEF